MAFEIPERLNVADYFLTDRLDEGRGGRVALRLDDRELTYAEVEHLAARFGGVLSELGARPEERVMIALPDGPETTPNAIPSERSSTAARTKRRVASSA